MVQINTICLKCGAKNDKKHKTVFGVWNDTCDMCGSVDVPCASAQHDFGIYNNPEEKQNDRIQDFI